MAEEEGSAEERRTTSLTICCSTSNGSLAFGIAMLDVLFKLQLKQPQSGGEMCRYQHGRNRRAEVAVDVGVQQELLGSVCREPGLRVEECEVETKTGEQ